MRWLGSAMLGSMRPGRAEGYHRNSGALVEGPGLSRLVGCPIFESMVLSARSNGVRDDVHITLDTSPPHCRNNFPRGHDKDRGIKCQ